MLRSLIGIILGFTAFGLSAQSHNLGLYELVSVSNGVATYDRVWSAYAPEVVNEPLLPGDVIYTPPGGGGMDPPPGFAVQSAPTFDPMLSMGTFSLSDGVQDRIQVVCGSACSSIDPLIWMFLQTLQGGGGGCLNEGGCSGGTGGVIRPVLPPPPPVSPCEISNEDLQNTQLTESQLTAINDFMNGAHGQNLWEASRFSAIMEWRQEWVSTFRSGHGWQQATMNWTHPCAGNFQIPWEIPDGSVFAHIHPFMAGDCMDLCAGVIENWVPGTLYESGPSPADIQVLIDVDGFDVGIIIDYDGITIFDETGAYDVIDDACGIERTGL